MNLLVSACLLGVSCRYDGCSKPLAQLDRLLKSDVHLVPICPEILGGLPTPRVPSERRGGCVVTRDGRDATQNYRRGAEEALRLARLTRCSCALLKERSPSCGCGRIYDGTFTGTLTDGNGVAAELLLQNGLRVFGESQLDELLNFIRSSASSFSLSNIP